MPYLTIADRENLPANPGSLNYMITRILLKTFIEHPKYETIHVLKRDFVTFPKDNPLLNKMRSDYAAFFTVSDINAAAALAYDEFYRRVGSAYEEHKRIVNTDLPEYEEAMTLIKQLGTPAAPVVQEAVIVNEVSK